MINPDTNYQFIQLKRTFHELSKYAPESDAVDLTRAFHIGDRLNWADLTKEYRLIILSEAGSGKTAEIRNVARDLRTEGKAAFFLRLENIPNDFEDAFEVGTLEAFEKWLASSDEGWLLLDSVDEARLRNPGDFDLSIRKLGRRIFAALDRSHIVITGRTWAWRPKTDLAFCVRHLPFAAATTTPMDDNQPGDIDGPTDEIDTVQTEDRAKDKEKSIFKIVALDDLNPAQIEAFVGARGIKDTKPFLEAVERADAWSFTARPQDLEELTEFWIDRGLIGSRLEIMRNSIERRLTERDQTRADARPLAVERTRKAAKLIAGVVTLAQEPTIRVPDGSDNSKGIAIQAILPEWDDRDQSTLLSRPIFDEAIYGTVRFHHRSVREYLTAEWFADLLERETSRRKIENLFFHKQYGVDVIVPTMRPILPWLAILDDKVRERLRRVAPEVILEGGDPSQLPLLTRKLILHEVCEQVAGGASGRSMTDYAAVQRFANPDLTEEVKILLQRYEGNDELIGFLLRMVWLGQLGGAAYEAKEIALSPLTSTYTRIAAFRAVRVVGSAKDLEDIRVSFRDEAPELEREWLSELTEDIEATPKALVWFVSCLQKAKPKKRFSVDQLTDAVLKFVHVSNVELLPQIALKLNNLLDQSPVVERRFCEVSEKFMWLMKPAAVAVERLIRARHEAAFANAAFEILHKIPAAREYDDGELRDLKSEFFQLVPAWPELNRAFFWFEVDRARRALDEKRGERLTDFWRVSLFQSFWRFETDDFDYVISEIGSRPEQDDKLVALSLAFQLYVRNGRPRAWLKSLKASVNANPELSDQLSKYLKPTARKETREWKRREAKWKRRAEEREQKEEKRHADWRDYISNNVDLLRDPRLAKPTNISSAQWYLHNQIQDKHGRSGRWTKGNWQIIATEHGDAAATAYRDGVVAYWRRYKPKLRSEGAPSNSTPYSVIFGLSGLEIEATETPRWASSLSEPEIELACRYASYELNGFPTWFPKLFEAHPTAVTGFLIQEIEYELSIEKPDEETHYILSDVSWSGEWSWDEVGPEIYARLNAIEPTNLINLRKLLAIVQGSCVPDDDLKLLAADKVGAVGSLEHAAQWFAVWVGVDPGTAIPALKAHIEKTPSENDRTSFAMAFVTNLWGGRRWQTIRVRQAFQTPQHLKSLYLLMHQYIKRKDDIDRAGTGVYSPGLRDNAQDSRNDLFDMLDKIPGKESFLAIEEISKSHPEESSRPWFTYLAKRKAERDADVAPWTPTQVRDFNNKLERTPANHRDLADLAILRLLDLKDDLENGDSSIAGILRTVALETDMRKYIGRELREKAFGRYVIPQEEELADAKRPDLRFHGVSFDGPVPVELKLADKWTGPALFERLENQLCGDYLRDNRSSRGLFLLVYRGHKAAWDVPGETNRVDFIGLLSALQSHWEQISSKYSSVDEITVVGIDLTKRSTRRAETGA